MSRMTRRPLCKTDGVEPLDRCPPPPAHFGRLNALAALHPVTFALLVGCSFAVFPMGFWIVGQQSVPLFGGLMMATLFGIQAYFQASPVPRRQLPPVLGGLAVAGWIAGLVLGADLFLGGLIIGGHLVAAVIGNSAGLAQRGRAERARARFAPSSDA